MSTRDNFNVKKTIAVLLTILMILSAVFISPIGAEAAGEVTFDNVDILMIYNPLRYHQDGSYADATSAAASTGDMSSTISPAGEKDHVFGNADFAGIDYKRMNFQRNLKYLDLFEGETPLIKRMKANNGLFETYFLTKPTVGETKTFYVDQQPQEFECLGVGQTSIIWIMKGDPNYADVSSKVSGLLDAMDNTVVANDHQYFGEGRFYNLSENNLINVLCHAVDATGNTMGFFTTADIYDVGELPGYQINRGIPVIHVNTVSCVLNQTEDICATLAHEYQHLIASTEKMTNTQGSTRGIETWFNETMAMEAIELSYPGNSADGQYVLQYNSATKQRDGQSIYNFTTYPDEIGAYGQALLFSQYLEKYLGKNVFKEFHTYWRENSEQTEGLGISKASSSDKKTDVDSTIEYLESVKTQIGTDEYLSKLVLCYNIATIQQGSGKYGISFNKGTTGHPALTEINPLLLKGTTANIEGGGRVLVKPLNGKYVVPKDANPNLIYVGFSKDGKTVTLNPTFAVTQYKVTYEDLTAGPNVIKPNTSSAIPAEKKYAEGETVKVEADLTTTETTYNGKTGTWTFEGWEPKVAGEVTITAGTDGKTFTMPNKDIVLVPKWKFTENSKFTVLYEWTAPVEANIPPGDLPNDDNEYDSVEAAKAAMDTTYTNTTTRPGTKDGKNGQWVFSGWKASVEGQEVTFKGSWTFKADEPSVTAVTVTPATASLTAGNSKAFTAEVTGENLTDKTVTWEVVGATSPNTKIDANGKLTVGADETATTLTVKATSTQDSTKSGTATVAVNRPEAPTPTVTKVEVAPATAEMEAGTNKTFTANVTGDNEPSQAVAWTVEGATSPNTKIDANGNLTVGADETATTLTVKATSAQDNTKSGTAVVTVTKQAPIEPAEPTVTKVEVSPSEATMDAGTDKTFSAAVTGENEPGQEVEWTVEGATSPNTKIDANGKLTVGEDETAATLTVKATSTQDDTKSGIAVVTINSKVVGPAEPTEPTEPGADEKETTIPVDTDGDGKADISLIVDKENADGTYTSHNGVKYFDPAGNGVFVKWLAPVLQDPPVSKKVTGETPSQKGSFTFTMTGENGAPMPSPITGKTRFDEKKNVLTADMMGPGGIEFGDISYSVYLVPYKGNSVTYKYILEEVNKGNESYSYDASKYVMTVTITNDGEKLVKDVKYTTLSGKEVDEICFVNVYKGAVTDTEVPETGDATETEMYCLILLIGISAIAIVSMNKKRI